MPADKTMHYQDTQAEIHEVVVGPMDNNVFVLRCRETGDAVLLDAANEHEKLLELCQRLGVRKVLETHGHWDHIQAVPADARERTGTYLAARQVSLPAPLDPLLQVWVLLADGGVKSVPGHHDRVGGKFGEQPILDGTNDRGEVAAVLCRARPSREQGVAAEQNR